MTDTNKTQEKDIQIIKVEISNSLLTAHLSDERIISIPIKRFARLTKAIETNNFELTQNFTISPSGYGIHWPLLDEDISIKSFL